MAIVDYVTVSMGEETIGRLRGIFFEKFEEILHCDLHTKEHTLIRSIHIVGLREYH